MAVDKPSRAPAPLNSGKTRDSNRPARAPRGEGRSPLIRAVVVCAVLLLAIAILYRELIFGGKVFWAPDSMSAASLSATGKKLLAQARTPCGTRTSSAACRASAASRSFRMFIPVNFVLGIFVRYLFFPEYSWLLFHTFLTGLGTFLLLRGREVRFSAALLAGVLMMWMPNLVAIGANGHGSQACAVAYLPLALFFWDRLWRGKGLVLNATALAIVLGFSMLRAHLQISYYTYALVGMHAFFFGVLRIVDAARWARDRTIASSRCDSSAHRSCRVDAGA
jgi:hypothetical protein